MKSRSERYVDYHITIILICAFLLIGLVLTRYLTRIEADKANKKENTVIKVKILEESIQEYFMENFGIYTPYNKPSDSIKVEPVKYNFEPQVFR